MKCVQLQEVESLLSDKQTVYWCHIYTWV